MKSRSDRRFALDLIALELRDAEQLAGFVARYALAPARRAHRLPEPWHGERDEYLFAPHSARGSDEVRHMRMMAFPDPAAHFDEVMRGLLLFAHLFPQAVWQSQTVPELLSHPGLGFTNAALNMAMRSYDELTALSRAALGLATPPLVQRGGVAFRAVANPVALEELAGAQRLLQRTFGERSDTGDYRRENIGLQAVDSLAASEIDEILRSEVRQRLVWLANFEDARPDDDAAFEWITFDRGVFPARVPETLRALVLLELVDAFALGQRVAGCSLCDMPVVLNAPRAARAAKGEPIYHEDCAPRYRRRYFQAYQAQRRATMREGSKPAKR